MDVSRRALMQERTRRATGKGSKRPSVLWVAMGAERNHGVTYIADVKKIQERVCGKGLTFAVEHGRRFRRDDQRGFGSPGGEGGDGRG